MADRAEEPAPRKKGKKGKGKKKRSTVTEPTTEEIERGQGDGADIENPGVHAVLNTENDNTKDNKAEPAPRKKGKKKKAKVTEPPTEDIERGQEDAADVDMQAIDELLKILNCVFLVILHRKFQLVVDSRLESELDEFIPNAGDIEQGLSVTETKLEPGTNLESEPDLKLQADSEPTQLLEESFPDAETDRPGASETQTVLDAEASLATGPKSEPEPKLELEPKSKQDAAAILSPVTQAQVKIEVPEAKAKSPSPEPAKDLLDDPLETAPTDSPLTEEQPALEAKADTVIMMEDQPGEEATPTDGDVPLGDGDVERVASPVKDDDTPARARTPAQYPEMVDEEEPVFKPTPRTMDLGSRDFDNIDPREMGIDYLSDEEYQYEPPERDDLPDLYKLMNTLDGGESDLEAEAPPPSFFQRPEHEPNYKKISVLRQEMEEEEIDPYISQFDDTIKDDVLMIGNISLEEVQDEERRLRDEHIAFQQQEAVLARRRQEDILLREEHAKGHVTKLMKEKRKALSRREQLNLQKERLLQDQLHKTFRKSENQLLRSLEIRKGEVKTMYGDLMMADGQYGGSKGRRWKVDWNRAPQPIQIKLKCLRGVKDKLPSGRYILMVSLYDRIGGHVLRWSSLRGQEWGGATLPMNHEGRFHNVEIKIDQSLFTVCPSKPSIRPGMMLQFELFLARGSLLPVDKVVAWGVFPICDGQFNIIQGKYVTPMLRGEADPQMDRHETIEKLMASDIDHWLSNLYFEVVKLPRYIAGHKEYEVELQFSSNLLSYPDRTRTAEEAVDGDEPIMGSTADVVSASGDLSNSIGKGSQASLQAGSSDKTGDSAEKASIERTNETGSQTGSRASLNNNEDIKQKLPTVDDKLSDLRYRGGGRGPDQPPPTVIGSRKLISKDAKMHLDSDDENSEDEDYLQKMDGFEAVKGETGLFYKHHMNPPATDYMRRLYTMLPKTGLLSPLRKKKKLTYLEELDTHTFAVQKPFSTKGRLARAGHEKVQYISRQLMSELGLSQWRSREFWTLIVLFCLLFFVRVYMHYLGQWGYLNIIGIPISKFELLPYSVNLNYQSSLLHTRELVAVVILGPLTNITILVLMVFAAWLCQKAAGSFPTLLCKLVIVYSIHAVLDPILIAIVDAPLGRYNYEAGDEPIADAAKLYYLFQQTHGTGLMGILMTVPIYLFLMFFAAVVFYMYFLRLHNNGRMLDIFHRLHAKQEEFFLPYDLEISNQELAYICKKAEQWRGEEGERRKVGVYDYIWEEEDVDEDTLDGEKGGKSKQEITTHVSIHTLHLDGLRELHRHFLRLPDGAIVEVFGEMGVVGLDKDLRAALQKGPTAQTNSGWDRMGSTDTLRTRQRPKTMGGFGSQDFLDIPPSPGAGARRFASRESLRSGGSGGSRLSVGKGLGQESKA
ncbi:uncharacterized protein LOC119725181 [Patiria miniata]|uniref:Uncharacterized protein n=1 Tax=Patiria miniata TaxID=46514 RepID=A0A913ZM97_PATMI|nr:uncharacterized protein LOC119725181 [Patiria miniata]